MRENHRRFYRIIEQTRYKKIRRIPFLMLFYKVFTDASCIVIDIIYDFDDSTGEATRLFMTV